MCNKSKNDFQGTPDNTGKLFQNAYSLANGFSDTTGVLELISRYFVLLSSNSGHFFSPFLSQIRLLNIIKFAIIRFITIVHYLNNPNDTVMVIMRTPRSRNFTIVQQTQLNIQNNNFISISLMFFFNVFFLFLLFTFLPRRMYTYLKIK